jgi:orotate phosphoribosyltransferase
MKNELKTISGYLTEGFTDPEGIFERAKRDLARIDYDTIIGTGFSGAVVIPELARRLGKNWALVRKESPYRGTHSGFKVEGTIGKRWLFVDDMVATGTTRTKVKDAVQDHLMIFNHTAHYAGTWSYNGDSVYAPR